MAAVFYPAEEVAEGDLGDVGVSWVGGDGPVGEGDADVVEACGADVGEGLGGDEGGVVLLELFCGFGGPELGGECVFVDDIVGGAELSEEGGRDEGFETEPAAYVHAVDLVVSTGVVPWLGYGRYGGICTDAVVVVGIEAHHRQAANSL